MTKREAVQAEPIGSSHADLRKGGLRCKKHVEVYQRTPRSQLRTLGAKSMEEIPGPRAQAQPSNAQSPPAQGERCPSHARYLAHRPRDAAPGGRKLPRRAPPRGRALGLGMERARVYKQGGGSAGRGREGHRPGPAGHSPRPLSPIPSRPASPGSGSRACCSPAAAAAAGSSQGRRRRHRDATPQCTSFLTPTGPHCPAACRGGRKGGRVAQDMTPGPRVGEPERRQGRSGGSAGDSGGARKPPRRAGSGLWQRGSSAALGSVLR